jgi:tetratricopeptide (TPR) repeat protein
MSYRIKIPPKSIPLDEAHLGTWGDRLLHSLEDNRRAVLAGVAVIIAAAGIVGGILWYDTQRTDAASLLLQRASSLSLVQASDKPKEAEDNLKQAIALYRQLVDAYPRTPFAAVGFYNLGNALTQQNDLSGAIEAYQQAVVAYAGNPMMVGLVHQRLAYAYLLKGDRELAAKSFSAIIDTPGALNRDHALFELGKLEEAQSRPEGALAHYQELMKTYPDSPLASEAGVRLKVLDVKKSSSGVSSHGNPSSPISVQPTKNSTTSSSQK